MQLLILDLDETLIYGTERPLERQADFQTELYYVYRRPYLKEFLIFCSQYFQVGVWTTAGEEYAQTVVKNIFTLNYPLQFLWSHNRCTRRYDPEFRESYYIKNLAKLKRKGYHLEEMITIDDTPQKLEKNYGNLVKVTKWLGDTEDRELLKLIGYLTELKEVDNIRKIEKRGWNNR